MPQTTMQTIQCPKCGAQLPGWAQNCQFCRTALGNNVQRPAGVPTRGGFDNRLSWQEVAYIAVAIIQVILGSFNFVRGMGWLGGDQNAFIGIMGAITAGLGVGLLAQQIWAQFLMKWNSILNIIAGCGMLLMSSVLLGAKSDAFQKLGVLGLLYGLFQIVINGFMVYLIHAVGDVD